MKKILAFVLCLVLVAGLSIAGTIAWLQDTSDTLTNTFTVGNINIELAETDTKLDADDSALTNSYKMVPGNEIAKDPEVTVKAGSEASYVFVKLVKSTDPAFDSYLEYEIAEGWKELTEGSGVYYREQAALTADGADDAKYAVLKDNKVTVKETVTKEMMDSLTDKLPTLTITAYAIQKDNIASASAAWTELGVQ
ncbi:MAG: SipW-dependent-type signal peptide-containing protein [Clostridia bacterium]|nr:SipW-dependent-type signal peptide-containing protein [Clostridia bacterium]